MNYIVFDLEWNQGPAKGGSDDVPTFEIIEIGAVKLDSNFRIIDQFQSLIKPQIYNTMHKYTAEIVNLDLAELKGERTFREVAGNFLHWCGRDYMFCIWGMQDLTELQRNMDYYHMKTLGNHPQQYYDVQKLYSLACEDGKTRTALSHVVEAEGLLNDRVPFHRAFGDAYYTALILQRIANPKLLEYVSFDNYRIPTCKKDQVLWKFENYTKFISQGYREKSGLLSNKNITCVRCIHCGVALRKKIPWYTPNNGKHYYTIAKCAEHGLMKGKIRVRKSKDDLYYTVKTVKQVDEAEAAEIINKRAIGKPLIEK